MITYKDIKKAVNTKLTNKFGIEINSNDVREGFNRPSFFVSFDNQNHSSSMFQSERSLTIRINYFPTDQYEYSQEILDVQERLEEVFNSKLSVIDRQFNIFETSSLVTDGVLEFSFDIQFSDAKNVSIDSDNPYIDENGQVVDENGNPITDNEGNPILVETMQTLEIKKG